MSERAGDGPRSDRPRIGVALGGGGARGWAHIGVLETLIEAGIAPSVVSGTSMGAAVGAAYVAERLDELKAWSLELDRRTVLGLFDFSLRGGLIQATRVFEHLQGILPENRIEDLRFPFGAVATDLELGSAVYLTSGPLRDALRASIAIPGLISPKRIGERWMVDGGLLDPVPVSLARALGAEFVIAVELGVARTQSIRLAPARSGGAARSPDEGAPAPDERAPRWSEGSDEPDDEGRPEGGASDRSGADRSDADRSDAGSGGADPAEKGPAPGRDLIQSLSELSDRFWAQVWPSSDEEPEESHPSIYQVIGQSLEIMQVRIARGTLAGDPPDLHIRPRLQNVGLMDFDRAEDAIREGARAAERALAAYADYRRPLDED